MAVVLVRLSMSWLDLRNRNNKCIYVIKCSRIALTGSQKTPTLTSITHESGDVFDVSTLSHISL